GMSGPKALGRKAWGIALALLVSPGCAGPSPGYPPIRVPGGVLFRLAAPAARQVFVVGTFNSWDPASSPLQHRTGNGHWEAVVSLPPGRHLYMFVVDGEWKTPPDAPHLLDDGFGRRNGMLIIE
ncbi:MAG: glycoside hydrolase family 13, partial [candidate division NC10 bacterium]|nr:glycoside hydrolase family 13 [candidate division NC10 bacterium]